jgi:hypothetical protein
MRSASRHALFVASFLTICCATSLQAYGPLGHEMVGAIADERLASTPTAAKIRALIEGISLEKAAVMPDEIKGWDRKGVDDPKTFRYYRHRKIDAQLRDFWRANQPTHDTNSAAPSHHWFHYTDVPVVRVEKYAEGTAGRSKWDVVHMIAYCVDVLRGRTPEVNDRRITKAVAIILLAHYVGDIHQPLHVGAQYFDAHGQVVDPETDGSALEDEGGNTFTLELSDEPPRGRGVRKKKLHGFWDNDAVNALFPDVPSTVPKTERQAQIDPLKKQLVHEMATHEPKVWRMPANLDIKNYAEAWADEILPIAHEAHERLRFTNVHARQEEDRVVAVGEAKEKTQSGQIYYRAWAGNIVRDELHKAGWRLADLLEKSLTSTSANVAFPPVAPEPVQAAPMPSGITPTSRALEASAARPHVAETKSMRITSSPASPYGVYPSNYKEIVTTWMKTHGMAAVAEQIDWQTEPKPAEIPGRNNQHLYGYLVIFNTPEHLRQKTRSVLIRDGDVINDTGF